MSLLGELVAKRLCFCNDYIKISLVRSLVDMIKGKIAIGFAIFTLEFEFEYGAVR